MVTTFGYMLFHEVHPENMMYDICTYTAGDGVLKDLPNGIEHITAHVFDNRHFALVHVDIMKKMVMVHDGYLHEIPLQHWNAYCFSILKKWKLIRNDDEVDVSNKMPRKSVPLIRTAGKKYVLYGISSIEQNNMTECGPIAMYTLWRILDEKTPDVPTKDIRITVVGKFLQILEQSEKNLMVKLPMSKCKNLNEYIVNDHKKEETHKTK